MNSSQSDYESRPRTQLIRCVFYIPKNREEYVPVMHTIHLDRTFHMTGKKILKMFGLFKFSYFVSDSIRLVSNQFHPCLESIRITLDPSGDKKQIIFLLLSLWKLTASEIFSPSTLRFPNICVHLSYSLTWSFSTIVIGELKAIDYLRHRTVWARFESYLMLPGLSPAALRWAKLLDISWKEAWSEWGLIPCPTGSVRDFDISNLWLLSLSKDVFPQSIMEKGLRG